MPWDFDSVNEEPATSPVFSSGALPDDPHVEEEVASSAFGWDEPLSDDEVAHLEQVYAERYGDSIRLPSDDEADRILNDLGVARPRRVTNRQTRFEVASLFRTAGHGGSAA